MGILIKVSKWECPICHEKGKIWNNSWRARRNGRKHLKKFHQEYVKEPILKTKKVGSVVCGRGVREKNERFRFFNKRLKKFS